VEADNVVPFGQGGPVSGPYGTFKRERRKRVASASPAAAADFGLALFMVRPAGGKGRFPKNWLKYEVDPAHQPRRKGLVRHPSM